MKDERALFEQLPDTAIITDAYGFILDVNRNIPGLVFTKGTQLKHIMPKVLEISEDEFTIGEKTFKRRVTPIKRNKNTVGYTILLNDISETKKLYNQRKALMAKQTELIEETQKVNERLEGYAQEARKLSDYEEQLLLARKIHDDSGHAITAIHTICQMCLSLKEDDPDKYRQLLKEGIEICQNALNGGLRKKVGSLSELMDNFKAECRFPIEITMDGEEPAFAKNLYDLIDTICREAYHNTIDHSMADTLFVRINMSSERILLSINDNGNFHGEFEKGFGLSVMEENILKSGGSISFIAEQGKGFGIEAEWENKNE